MQTKLRGCLIRRDVKWPVCATRGTFAYLDDIMVASETEEQHIQDLHNLAKRLSDKGLLIAENKWKFGVDQLTFLGFHVTKT